MSIPAERLIPRLARLEDCCVVTTVRADLDGPARGHRGWIVTIARRGAADQEAVRAVAPALIDALSVAIAQAEARGWHQLEMPDARALEELAPPGPDPQVG